MSPPLPTPLHFDNPLVDYIPLVDPSPLPMTIFLPSIEVVALTDPRGRRRNILDNAMPLNSTMEIDEKQCDDECPCSEGAADAILEEGITM